MQPLEEHIKRINEKLQRILKNGRLLQKEVERQNKLINELQKAKENDSYLIENLTEQVILLKAASGQMNSTDKNAWEKNINQYIREIDKCINLLSE